jgi:surface antigen
MLESVGGSGKIVDSLKNTMDTVLRRSLIYLNLTGYYLARGWAIWLVRRIAGIACCLGLMAMLPIMSWNSSQLSTGAPVKVANVQANPGSAIDIEPAPAPPPAPPAEQQLVSSSQPVNNFTRTRRRGNSYVYGHCTFYVAQRRADIPPFWGHARSWYSSAQRSGYRTGTVPAVGAVAWTPFGWYGHVALVEEVRGDQVLISEMNYVRWNAVNTRWVNASEFKYIY